MRHTLTAIAIAMLCLSLGGCKKKADTGDIITQKVVKKKSTAPIAMQPYTQKKDIDWGGSKLTCEIQRVPDDSLPSVKDESGQRHIDNRITLKITRPDGSVFFAKTFTKATFNDYLDNDYRKTGVLEGFVFDKIDGGNLCFAASVCHPQTDEYIPFVVLLSRTGSMSISRDTTLDTNGTEPDDEQ